MVFVSQAFLGVDPSVRIDYVGPKTVAGSVGLFSRYVTWTAVLVPSSSSLLLTRKYAEDHVLDPFVSPHEKLWNCWS